MTCKTDRDNALTQFAYDSAGDLTKTITYTDALGRVTRTEVRNAACAIVGESYPSRFEQALTAHNSLQDVATYPKDGPLLTRP